MTDHKKAALGCVDGLHDWQAEEGQTDATMLANIIEANMHATLALVEQQRIANLIALYHLDAVDTSDFVARGINYPAVAVEIMNGLDLA